MNVYSLSADIRSNLLLPNVPRNSDRIYSRFGCILRGVGGNGGVLKADCFFEKSICISLAFAEFEKNLYSNLKDMLDRIVEGDIEALLLENLGEPRFVAKKTLQICPTWRGA
jgi:hypothetical protein